MDGYKSHIQPPEPTEAYMYPLHLIFEEEYECTDCGKVFNPPYTYNEDVVSQNTATRCDVIEFTVKCPSCDEEQEYSYRFYYD